MTKKLGNILVFGGTGFFGKALIHYLMSESDFGVDTIYLSTRNPEKYKNIFPFDSVTNVEFVKFDLAEESPCLAIRSIQFDHIIHAAATSTDALGVTPLSRFNEIVLGTEKILEYIRDYQPYAKVLYVSSGGVYGEMPQGELCFSEFMNTSPPIDSVSNTYSISKKMAEHLCFLYSVRFGLNITIARCFAFSGSFLPLDVHFAIGNFVLSALKREKIVIHGDGSPLRSYLDQRDLANWLFSLLQSTTETLRIFNVGSERAISIRDLAYKVNVLAESNAGIVIKGSRESRRNVYLPDTNKIRNELGVSEAICLEDSILTMLSGS